MTVRQQQKLVTRHRLIAAAVALSAEKGFSALSLREITKAADLTPAAFYRHFRDLDELGLVLIDEIGLTLRQLLRDSRRSYDREEGRVRASIAAFLNYVATNPHHFRLLLGERLGSSAAFRQALRDEIDLFVAELAEDIEQKSSQTGTVLPKAALAAEIIVTVVFTVGAEALDLPPHRRNGLADRLVEEVHIILRGARASPDRDMLNRAVD